MGAIRPRVAPPAEKPGDGESICVMDIDVTTLGDVIAPRLAARPWRVFRSNQTMLASKLRWRSVMDSTVFVSGIPMRARNFLLRVVPQRRWLVRSSAIVMFAASHGAFKMTSPTVIAPLPTSRFNSARARRTSLAR
ncbi:MAG TPA: hypothetical protein VF526_06875 [Solirubrobacteraceae bacterium]|jgi:hypothetical protein